MPAITVSSDTGAVWGTGAAETNVSDVEHAVRRLIHETVRATDILIILTTFKKASFMNLWPDTGVSRAETVTHLYGRKDDRARIVRMSELTDASTCPATFHKEIILQ